MCSRRVKAVLLLSLLVPLSISFASPTCAAAAAAPEPEHRLEEIVVLATRLADLIQELRRVPGQVYTVTREEIERERPRSVQEALRQVPGIVTFDQVGNPLQGSLDLRGFNAQPNPSIAVFVDGVRVNDPDSNAVNFDLIPIQDVERIEVLPGATAIFGRNALGGVVNIVTRRGGAHPRTTVEAGGGSYRHYRVSASTSGPIRAFDYYLSAHLDRESGSRDFSDGRLAKAAGRVGYRPSEATDLSLAYQYVNDHLEQAGTISLPALDQNRRQNITPVDFSANELSAVTLQARQKLPWGLSVAANGFYRQTSRTLQTIGLTSVARNVTDTGTGGGTLQLSHEAKWGERLHRLSLGAELQRSGVNTATEATFFGFPFPSQRLVDDATYGFYAQEAIDLLPNLTLTGAVRFDRTRYTFADQITPANDGSKGYRRLTPRAGLAYTLPLPLTLYASYGEGFRVPTTDELFAFAGFGSNAGLEPVKSRSYEVGARSRPLPWLEANLALFLIDVRDEIVFDPLVPPFGQNINAPKSRREGVEVGLRLKPHHLVEIQASYTYTDARFRSDATLTSGFVERGDRLPLVPEHRGSATLTLRPLAGLDLSLTGQYVGRQILLNDEPNALAYRIQDAVLLGARAAYTWKHFTWFVQGNNLTDAKVETYGIVSGGQIYLTPAAGFNLFAGMTVRFEDYY